MDDEEAKKLEEKRVKNIGKRRMLMAELVATETSYVAQLEALESVYIMPLQANKVLPLNILDTLFSNVRSVLVCNQGLLKDLQKNVTDVKEGEDQMIGQIFIEFGDFFQMYHGYVKGNVAACKMVEKLKQSNTKFGKFCESCDANPLTKGLGLNSLLITPVQRVPRYRMLLDEIIKCTEDNHPDSELIQKAMVAVKAAAAEINEAVRSAESRELLSEMESEKFTTKINLAEPGRVFLKEGVLVKQCR